MAASPLGDVTSGDASQLFKTYETAFRRIADDFAQLHAVQAHQKSLCRDSTLKVMRFVGIVIALSRITGRPTVLRIERREQKQSVTNSSSSGRRKTNTGPSVLPMKVKCQRSCGDR